MQTIELTQIQIPEDRQRQTFDADELSILAKAIQDVGLLSPIVLRSDGVTLAAGERRFRAIKQLTSKKIPITHNGQPVPLGSIPFVKLSSSDTLTSELAELLENTARVNLTWQEEAKAVAKVYSYYEQQDPDTAKIHTVELISQGAKINTTERVEQPLLLAKHMEDPDVAKASSRKEAVKIMQRKAKEGILTTLFEEGEKKRTSAPVVESRHKLLKGDAREVLKDLPSNSIDVILTDPPYGIGANSFGDQAASKHTYEDSEEYFWGLMEPFLTESYRILKEDSHLLMFFDVRYYTELKDYAADLGFSVRPRPLIWSKGNGMCPMPDFGTRNSYDCILWLTKGKRKLHHVRNDVFDVRLPARPIHAAEKPVELYKQILEFLCFPGDQILDPFAGSGPIFPAANLLNLTATGINLDEADYQLAKSRMEGTE